MKQWMFKDRKLVVATMHGKEDVIAPLLKEALGVCIVAATDFDTDAFGTFTGERERLDDPLTTARNKCRAAASRYRCSLAIASEGSFGPHPAMYVAAADDEILVLLDLEHDLEFKVRHISTETNFNGKLLSSWQEVEQFAKDVLFPSHGLVARKAPYDTDALVKGIRSWKHLHRVAHEFLDAHQQVFIETDMRAMHNPTRMKVIEQATRKLIRTIERLCPVCQTPGFDIIDLKEGLPCELCGSPTRSTLAYILVCQRCHYREEQQYPHNKTHESPMYCDWCNP